MKIRDVIRKHFENRLKSYPCLVVYDPEERYREIVLGMSNSRTVVVDAGRSTIEGREAAMSAWTGLARDPHGGSWLVVYLPIAKPGSDPEKMRDPYSFLWAGRQEFDDGVFPILDGDGYQSLCREAQCDFVDQIDALFAAGVPDFDTVDSLDTGNNWPKLRSLLNVESGQEILVGLICPNARQKKRLTQDETWQDECRRFCGKLLGFKLNGKLIKWKSISDEIACFLLFSEFVLDLPDDKLPSALSTVPHADPFARTLVYGVCESLRSNIQTENRYLELANQVSTTLKLEQHTMELADLGERDTFSFEERTFLRKFARAAEAGDLDLATAIIETRKKSIWVRNADRQMEWTVADRGVALFHKIDDLEAMLSEHNGSLCKLVEFYVSRLREVDRLQRIFEQAVDDLYGETETLEGFIKLLRSRYRSFTETTHNVFMRLVEDEGWPATGLPRQTEVFSRYIESYLTERKKTALIMVDALRFELGVDLHSSLSETFRVQVEAVAAQLPTATPVGMASLLPEADSKLRIGEYKAKLVPMLAGKPVLVPDDRLQYTRSIYGDRADMADLADFLGSAKFKLSDTVQLLLVKTSDIDWMGESHPRLTVRNLQPNVKDIMAAVRKLKQSGFDRVVITTDHGFILLPETQPGDTVDQPSGNWPFVKRRCLMGKGAATRDVLVFGASHVGIKGDVENYAVPRTLATFSSGKQYFHEGLSLQECILPVICVDTDNAEEEADNIVKPELVLSYKGGRRKITTRRPVIEAELTDGSFVTELTFSLQAVDAEKQVVGHAAACDCVDPASGFVKLLAGVPVKIPIRMDDEFEGNFELVATDPNTSITYDRLKLKTDYLE
jgi:hypothetical protein